jgi:subtilisin-like proprotein convertase family protein
MNTFFGRRIALLFAVAALTVAPQFSAADITMDTGAGFPIPDDGDNGTIGGFVSGTINVTGHTSGPNLQIIDVEIKISADHTWIGDIKLMVESPSGTRVGLMSRPGLAEPGDGSGCCGLNVDWLGSNETWNQGPGVDPETDFTAGNLGIGTQWQASPDTTAIFYGAGADLADFNGEMANGVWTLYATDAAGQDIGDINNWMLTIETQGQGCAFALGDVNQDGLISLLDVSPFVNRLTSGTFQCEADINMDGQVTLLDVAGFVAILTGG